ncbi:hypothetical protein HYV50_02115 [Candidatus Pacearchaeota archaeon]|nr:hypothetical protein [Candidatus Pacearchaeota archaeon]
MELVAFLGKEKENLGQLAGLINNMDCEKIFLVKDKNAGDLIKHQKCKTIAVDTAKDLLSLKNEIKEKLKQELNNDFEVALSIASGSGKEHMALISALLSIPVGIRFVAYTKKGIEFLE